MKSDFYSEIKENKFKQINEIEQALRIHDVVGRSEQLVCESCGYEINPAGVCINMNCSTNENP